MLVNVRGTSGSGKSTLVRKVMEKYSSKEPIMAGRKQPYGYFCYRPEARTLFVPGHYETACGGTDTLPSIDVTYDLIRKYMGQCDVIWEGLITQSDVKRCTQLHTEGNPLLVIALNTSIEECLASVKSRRDARAAAKGKEAKELNPDNTIAKFNQLRPQQHRFQRDGVDFRWLSRQDALDATLTVLGWN